MHRTNPHNFALAALALLSIATLASAKATNSSGNAPPPGNATVEETVIGPSLPNIQFQLSPHGLHAAIATTSGSRAVMLYDNVSGPKFDEIFNNSSTSVSFSPDGTRWAYCARAGNEWVVMVDGKEAIRSSESNQVGFNWQTCPIVFSPNSKHFYVAAPVDTTLTRLYFDGKSVCEATTFNPVFSPDGDRYAVYCSDARGEHAVLNVDGRPAGYFGQDPQWSADSKHLFTTNTSTTTEILLDGKSFIKAEHAKITIPPVGNMVVAILTRSTNGPRVSFLVIGGKKVEGSEADMIQNVVISPDGKHYAARCQTKGKTWILWDGKKGQLYDSLMGDDLIKFTADSSLVVYNPNTNGKQFLVMGEQESDGFAGTLTVVRSPSGHRAGTLYSWSANSFVIIDSKTYPVGAGPNQAASFLSFSPDAAHFAYVANHQLFVDGKLQPNVQVTPNLHVPNEIPSVFSPDSKHIAFGATNGLSNAGSTYGVFVDGRFVPTSNVNGRGFYQMTFTSDSKHLYWLVDGKPTHQYGTADLFLDGQFVVEVLDVSNGFLVGRGGWDLLPDGSLLLLKQDENGLKRLHIIPSPGTSSDTILTSGIRNRP